MKRPIFLIIATVLILILAGVWVYVLLYGNPENLSEQFTDFNFENEEVADIPPPPVPEPTPTVDVTEEQSLQQLTTTPVAGYQLIQASATSTAFVYYVETGTGHLFSINLDSGEEVRLSRTTIPNTNKAAITPNGSFVLIISGTGAGQETLVGTRSSTTDTLLTTTLKDQVADIHPTTNNTFLYSTPNANTMVVKEYNPTTDTTETLFTIPFREATLVWGNTADSTHYMYPKANKDLEGYVYKVTDRVISRTNAAGFGLSATGNEDYLLFSHNNRESYLSEYTTIGSGDIRSLPITVLPEKCAVFTINRTTLLCAASFSGLDEQSPNNWYDGTAILADNLWLVNLKAGAATLRENITNTTGRELDIINPQLNPLDSHLLFQNKSTNNLWLYLVR